ALGDRPGPRAVSADVQRRPGVAADVLGLDPVIRDRDPDQPSRFGDGVGDGRQLGPPVRKQGRQHSQVVIAEQLQERVIAHADMNAVRRWLDSGQSLPNGGRSCIDWVTERLPWLARSLTWPDWYVNRPVPAESARAEWRWRAGSHRLPPAAL